MRRVDDERRVVGLDVAKHLGHPCVVADAIAAARTIDAHASLVKLANDTRYGLNSSVWTKDIAKGEQVADRIEAGSTCVNDANVNYAANALPFGGWKESGIGVQQVGHPFGAAVARLPAGEKKAAADGGAGRQRQRRFGATFFDTKFRDVGHVSSRYRPARANTIYILSVRRPYGIHTD